LNSVCITRLATPTVRVLAKQSSGYAHAITPAAVLKIKGMETQASNPIMCAIKRFSDNPMKLQQELGKMVEKGSQKVCKYLVNIIEAYDKGTATHAKGVATTATRFAAELGLSAKKIKRLEQAALLHDIGKIFTPIEILRKNGKLTNIERKIIERHAPQGEQFLHQLGLTRANSSFSEVSRLAGSHHSPIDTTNFSGQEKLMEEILKLSDVFNALRSKRTYKEALSLGDTIKLLQQEQQSKGLCRPETYNKFVNFVIGAYSN